MPPPDPAAERLARFEAQRRTRAQQLQAQGLLADALLAWETLALLKPDHAEYQQQLASTRQAIAQATTQRLSRAQAARQRGDLVAAEKALLEALTLNPNLQAAASGLREIEAERNRASVVGKFASPTALLARGSRTTMPAPSSAPMPRGQASAPTPPQSTNQRNLLEHASLLASQGEIDAAIALLSDSPGGNPRDAEGKPLLARLLAQRAEARWQANPRASRTDIERAVDLDPGLKDLRARLLAR